MLGLLSIEDAIKVWEEKTGEDIGQSRKVALRFMYPPIQKMDNSLAALKKCELLDLSNNIIERISGLEGLKRLRILMLTDNCISNIDGLEAVAETLEDLCLSRNMIEKLTGIAACKKLKLLHLDDNLVEDWAEFDKLRELPLLEELKFADNPLHCQNAGLIWRFEVTQRLPNLKMLDYQSLQREETE